MLKQLWVTSKKQERRNIPEDRWKPVNAACTFLWTVFDSWQEYLVVCFSFWLNGFLYHPEIYLRPLMHWDLGLCTRSYCINNDHDIYMPVDTDVRTLFSSLFLFQTCGLKIQTGWLLVLFPVIISFHALGLCSVPTCMQHCACSRASNYIHQTHDVWQVGDFGIFLKVNKFLSFAITTISSILHAQKCGQQPSTLCTNPWILGSRGGGVGISKRQEVRGHSFCHCQKSMLWFMCACTLTILPSAISYDNQTLLRPQACAYHRNSHSDISRRCKETNQISKHHEKANLPAGLFVRDII